MGALFNRKSVFADALEGNATVQELNDTASQTNGVLLLLSALAIATTIVTSIWSLRTARHAVATGARNVSPGWACGGWYIPIAAAVVPFIQLRRVAAHRGRSVTLLTCWQVALVALWGMWLALRGAGSDEVIIDNLESQINTQQIAGVGLCVALGVAAFCAMRATANIDAAARA